MLRPYFLFNPSWHPSSISVSQPQPLHIPFSPSFNILFITTATFTPPFSPFVYILFFTTFTHSYYLLTYSFYIRCITTTTFTHTFSPSFYILCITTTFTSPFSPSFNIRCDPTRPGSSRSMRGRQWGSLSCRTEGWGDTSISTIGDKVSRSVGQSVRLVDRLLDTQIGRLLDILSPTHLPTHQYPPTNTH